MFFAKRKQAAAAFSALCALDASAGARAELASSGVSHSRIQSLYPASEFTEVADGLIARLPTLSATSLLSSMGQVRPALDGVIGTMSTEIVQRASPFELDERPDDDARTKLSLHFIRHFGRKGESTGGGAHFYAANDLSAAIWWGWWTASNRAILPRKLRALSDELVLSVASVFELQD
jgi:hypothetical protein